MKEMDADVVVLIMLGNEAVVSGNEVVVLVKKVVVLVKKVAVHRLVQNTASVSVLCTMTS